MRPLADGRPRLLVLLLLDFECLEPPLLREPGPDGSSSNSIGHATATWPYRGEGRSKSPCVSNNHDRDASGWVSGDSSAGECVMRRASTVLCQARDPRPPKMSSWLGLAGLTMVVCPCKRGASDSSCSSGESTERMWFVSVGVLC